MRRFAFAVEWSFLCDLFFGPRLIPSVYFLSFSRLLYFPHKSVSFFIIYIFSLLALCLHFFKKLHIRLFNFFSTVFFLHSQAHIYILIPFH